VGDIARDLNRPVATVRTQIRRGLTLLRKALPNSMIAGTVVLTTPVEGMAAIREVVLSKAAAVSAAGNAV
jgi:hypothetical protein